MSAIATNPYRKLSRENEPRTNGNVGWPVEASEPAAVWTPAVDIYETVSEIVVRAELPGVTKESLQVQVENNLLTVTGSRNSENNEARAVLRLERPWGNFSRRFTLPGNIDQGKIRSEFNQGILRVFLPKREEAKPRQIEVTIS
ncbi:MAG TPA: Hsp20/alpha crystallin family protein [Blastocatellia bacterium]|nr:Hsp20/alpha crystallin family protein [Blastocatellia bacterium]